MSHRSAVNAMGELQNLLRGINGDADRDVRMLLLYAGISVQRRLTLGADGEEGSDLEVTLALLFILQVLCDGRARSPEPQCTGHSPAMSPSLFPEAGATAPRPVPGPDTPPLPDAESEAIWEDQQTIEKASAISLKEIMQHVESDGDSAWAQVMRLSPAAVCRACVSEGPRLGSDGTLRTVARLGKLFFRNSALTLQYNMLEAQDPGRENRMSFLTLSTADIMTSANDDLRDAKLAALVDSGESEAGQQVLRDMILSFTLPQSVIGVRRLPLLSREANAIATEQYTVLLGEAHEAAMHGAEWTWKEDPNPIHKMAALLSGLCIMMAGKGGSADIIRKKDAFAGRVQLPFLETAPPEAGLPRLGYVPHRNEWIVYSIDRKGRPVVEMKHAGFEGLCLSVLCLTGTSRI